jgi:hypothetical protein
VPTRQVRYGSNLPVPARRPEGPESASGSTWRLQFLGTIQPTDIVTYLVSFAALALGWFYLDLPIDPQAIWLVLFIALINPDHGILVWWWERLSRSNSA